MFISNSEIVESRTNIEIPQTSFVISLVTSQLGDIEDTVTRGLVFHEKIFSNYYNLKHEDFQNFDLRRN